MPYTPSLLGVCSNWMKKPRSHWHLGPLHCWLWEECSGLISLTERERVKANLPYEKQLWHCWLELLCSEKVLLSLSVWVQTSSLDLLHEVFIMQAKHWPPHGGNLFGLKVTVIQTEGFHDSAAPINCYSFNWSCLVVVLPPVFMWQLHAEWQFTEAKLIIYLPVATVYQMLEYRGSDLLCQGQIHTWLQIGCQ